MSEPGPSTDNFSPPSSDPSTIAPSKPIYSGHDQTTIPTDARPTIALMPTDDRTRVQYSSHPYIIPERATPHLPEPPIVPLSAARPPSANRVPIVPPLPQIMPVNHPEVSPLPHRTTRGRLLAFFGFGSGPELRDRKDLRSLIWTLGYSCAQITAIIILLVYSSGHPSPQLPDVSEWKACNKPLGLWNSLWAVKSGFDCLLAWWSYRRELASRAANPTNADVETRATPGHMGVDSSGIVRLDQVVPPRGTNEASSRQSRTDSRNNPDLPHSLYPRLSVLISFFAFVWFITSNVFIYTSVGSCRLAAPHLWWLSFAILSLTYLMLLELLLLGLIVFIIGPIVYLIWNLALMCLGRHALQNPDIKPQVTKLSKAVVDKIPLVIYIPAPKDQESTPIQKPLPAHTYPPTPEEPKPMKRRFFFLKKRKPGESNSKQKGEAHGDSDSGNSWEDTWEKGEYPFVRLENNRATCAICLMDFDEPRKVGENLREHRKEEGTEAEVGKGEAPRQHEGLKLEDAGEGAQPLRLLACGHAFHKMCLDPWLTGMSGRCPTCQRPVEMGDGKAKKPRNAQV